MSSTLLKSSLLQVMASLLSCRQQLNSTNLLVQALLIELTREFGHSTDQKVLVMSKLSTDDLTTGLPDEVKLAAGPNKLPLGYSPRMGSDEVIAPVRASCFKFHDELVKYMTYDIGGECPVDDVFAQRLMLKGCEPLPRRRCKPKSQLIMWSQRLFLRVYGQHLQILALYGIHTLVKTTSALLIGRMHLGILIAKIALTFDLQGREKSRWLIDNGKLDYGIDKVLSMKPPGTIRVGFDIVGGSGTFAARMKERNVTIITSSLNLDGPFNSFIASRGLIRMHVSVSRRLPFFENTVDIVHSMHVLSNWIPDAMLEFTLYDIYRVLRPGDIFWLDRFFCFGS